MAASGWLLQNRVREKSDFACPFKLIWAVQSLA